MKEGFQRPANLEGMTMKLKLHEGSLYVTVNRDKEGVKEVFVTLGKSGGDEKAHAEALGRLISLYLQRGGEVKDVIRTLKGIQGKHVVWDGGLQLLSVPDAIAKVFEIASGIEVQRETRYQRCPECGSDSLILENGCAYCSSCGYNRCG